MASLSDIIVPQRYRSASGRFRKNLSGSGGGTSTTTVVVALAAPPLTSNVMAPLSIGYDRLINGKWIL
jgi:hypothetical protein